METFYNNKKPSRFKKSFNKLATFFSKPQNIILVIFAVVLTVLVFIPIISVFYDTFIIHEGAALEDRGENVAGSLSFYSWARMMTGA